MQSLQQRWQRQYCQIVACQLRPGELSVPLVRRDHTHTPGPQQQQPPQTLLRQKMQPPPFQIETQATALSAEQMLRLRRMLQCRRQQMLQLAGLQSEREGQRPLS